MSRKLFSTVYARGVLFVTCHGGDFSSCTVRYDVSRELNPYTIMFFNGFWLFTGRAVLKRRPVRYTDVREEITDYV